MFDKTWRDVAWFGASGFDEFVRLSAIVSIGMCRSVSAGVVTPAYACHRLFGPAFVSRAKDAANQALVEALLLASEIEDVSELAPQSLASLLTELELRFLAVLRDTDESAQRVQRWLGPRVRLG